MGHGFSGPAHRLIDDQYLYLQTLDILVTAALDDGQGVSSEETDNIVLTLRLMYPHHQGAAFMPPEDLIRASVNWVSQQ